MLYVCAGMYRSASTWLYNVVRVTLSRTSDVKIGAGWCSAKKELLEYPISVIKIHAFDRSLARKSPVVLISHRDLRDVVASAVRKFNREPSVALAREALEHYLLWAERARYDMQYERMITDRLGEVKRIVEALELPKDKVAGLDYASLLEEVESEKFQPERSPQGRHDAVNLLHNGHITDGRPGAWKEFLPATVAEEIKTEFHDWLSGKGYLQEKA